MLERELRDVALSTKGFMPPEEGDALYDAAQMAAESLPTLNMVEVGSYCGRSTVWIGSVARRAGVVLYAVDHHGGSEENQPGWEWFDPSVVDPVLGRINTLPFFEDTMRRAGLEGSVRAVVGDSASIGSSWNEQVSFLFVDGGHGREVARGDYATWHRHVAPGGVMAVHDVFVDPRDGGQAPYEEIYLPATTTGGFVEVSRTGSLRILKRTS